MQEISCPLCQTVMEPGRVAVHKNIATKLNWPFRGDRLVFKAAEEGSKPELVIKEGASYTAYKCESCTHYLVTQDRYV